MPYTVVKKGSQHCVQKSDGSKTFGCHDSRRKALAQLRALYSNERKVN